MLDQASPFEVRQLRAGFGAEVLDVDLKAITATEHAAIIDVFHRHGALLVRDQDLSPDDLIAFLSGFGALEDNTLLQYTLPGYPKIYVLSNRTDANGNRIGIHNNGIGWHTDYSYAEVPVMSTMLYAVEVPPEGSDTLLADCVAAYAALSPEMKAKLDPLVLHHSYKYFQETRKHAATKLSKEVEEANPDVLHPLIRVHPKDGRRALWVSTGTVKGIRGMDADEALELIDELVDYVTQDRFVYRHKWRAGDILMWDNRCTLHTGTLYDDQKYHRTMHRLWVKGQRPVGPPEAEPMLRAGL